MIFFINHKENGGHELQSRTFSKESGARVEQISFLKMFLYRKSKCHFCLGNIYQWPFYLIMSIFIVPYSNRIIYIPFFRSGQRFKFVKRIWLSVILRFFHIITISKFEARYLRLHFKDASILVRKNVISQKKCVSTRKLLSSNVFVIGRLYNHQKGLWRLLRHSHLFLDRNLHLIGESSEKSISKFSERMQSSNMKVYGFLNNPWTVVDGVLLVPSVYEGLPLILMEASAKKIPVIAHNIPELRLLVKTEYLFDFENGETDDLIDILKIYEKNDWDWDWETLFFKKYMSS